MRIEDALESYVVQLEADGRSAHTLGQVRRHVGMLIRWLAASDNSGEVGELRHEDLARFLSSSGVTKRADGAPRKPTSANALRSSLRTFFSYTHGAGYCTSNPARMIRRARCAPPRPKALSDGDTAKLLAALEQARTRAERRDRVLFHVLLRVGLRVGTAVALQIEDVDLDGALVRLRRMKGNAEDSAYLSAQTVELLREHVAGRQSGAVFRGAHGQAIGTRQVHRRLATWAMRAGISRAVWPHSLRHSFATRVYQATGDLLVTARALCHRSVASTAVYARPSEAAVRAAVAR